MALCYFRQVLKSISLFLLSQDWTPVYGSDEINLGSRGRNLLGAELVVAKGEPDYSAQILNQTLPAYLSDDVERV